MNVGDTLRAAAEKIREIATAATPGPWTAHTEDVNTYPDGGTDYWYEGDVTPYVVTGSEWSVCDKTNANWIAVMSPLVAAPIADILDAHANQFDHDGYDDALEEWAPLALAHLILGDAADPATTGPPR